MPALLISILKITIPPEMLIPEWLEISNGEVNRFDVGSSEKIARKLEK